MSIAATTSTSTSIGHSVGNFFEGILNFLVRIAESNGRMKAVERLNAMSDAELAARGLQREDIVRHVFRDMFYV
ncbi:hypothetical protein P775_25715 [Puniceibacterium antarcticum]|uniref:DUF1127 domain-containing protein n=1 Tax=Puniceibacterium antarcticum TaxID=1206336 RepID=A0A2G8R344_9RHOB|nr:DUF1127 domain-containing protein [Puniceibacterium antarcticum]PIL15578.1 hypothetical protein P775_25715 [Puniceibacterium antarcticum]